MLIDSNIIIYAMHPEMESIRAFITEKLPSVSAISYVEVMGYHKLSEQERYYLEIFFKTIHILPISQKILDYAVSLRQTRRMTLGDALIAGTALSYKYTLVTRNIQDFNWIEELKLCNPFEKLRYE